MKTIVATGSCILLKTRFWKKIGRRKSLVRCGVAVGRVGDVGCVKTQRLLISLLIVYASFVEHLANPESRISCQFHQLSICILVEDQRLLT